MMSERVYRVVDDNNDIYWVDDATTIVSGFGKVLEVTKFDLSNPLDVTDLVNGGYTYELSDY